MASLPRARSPEHQTGALTASAFKVTRGTQRNGEQEFLQRKGLAWQNRSLTYYSLIGEVRYGCSFYSRMMKRLRIFPAVQRGELEHPEPITEGLPVDLLNRIRDPGGGRSKILGDYGRLMFATGEGYLFGRDLNTLEERWSFVWGGELDLSDPELIIWRPGTPLVRYFVNGPEAVAYRMWTPHPARSFDPDAPMMGVLDICEELLILTKSVMATATSRIAKRGMLLMPQEMAPPPVDPGSDEDPLVDPFMADFIADATANLENVGTAEAALPFLVWGASEYLEKIKHIATHNPQDDYVERDLRTEAIKRLALGFDMPPEELLGMAQANHWTAWQIQDSTWQSHGAPIAEQFCDDLNEAYLRPSLREQGYEDWENVVIRYDAAEVVVNPDRSDDANEAFDRGAIGFTYYRKMKNIPEGAAMTEEDLELWLQVKGRGDEPEVAESAPDARETPEDGPDAVRERTGRAATVLSRELGAADMALLRCRELAGIRLRQKQKLCPDCFRAVGDSAPALIAHLVGQDALPRLGFKDTRELTSGGADGLRQMLVNWGYSPVQAGAFSEMVEVYASRTLFDPRHPQLPAAWDTHLEQVREVA